VNHPDTVAARESLAWMLDLQSLRQTGTPVRDQLERRPNAQMVPQNRGNMNDRESRRKMNEILARPAVGRVMPRRDEQPLSGPLLGSVQEPGPDQNEMESNRTDIQAAQNRTGPIRLVQEILLDRTDQSWVS
jgi:hypothetical protein